MENAHPDQSVHAAAIAVAVVLVPAALALVQVLLFPAGQSIGWLGIGPLLASLVLRWQATAVIAGYTLVVGLVLVVVHPGPSTAADGLRLVVVAVPRAPWSAATCSMSPSTGTGCAS